MRNASRCLSLLLAAGLAACVGHAKLRATVPTPGGPIQIEIVVDGRPTTIDNTHLTRTVNNKVYELYRDSTGTEWLRDPNPPNQLVRADTLRPQQLMRDADTLAELNTRRTSRPVHWDFHRDTAATALSATGLDRVSNQRGIAQAFRGATLASFDPQSLATHVVYPMRADIGIPDLGAHLGLRYDIQLVDGFMSVAIEGDLREVCRFLAQQGIRTLRGTKVEQADTPYVVDTYIDEANRVVSFYLGAHLLRAMQF